MSSFSFRRVTSAALAGALLLAPGGSDAQPLPASLDVPSASLVITGRVASVSSNWDLTTGTIVTYVAVDVTERLRGPNVPGRVVLKQLGGEVGAIGMWIAGQASFRAGEETLLFLSVSPRDGTLHTTGLSRGKPAFDAGAVSLIRDRFAAFPASGQAYVAVPREYDDSPRAPLFSFLPTDGGFPARWHEVDDNVPVFVDHPSALPGGWTGSPTNATTAINLWRGSGMDLDLRDGGANQGGGCPVTFTGNGRIAVAYDDPCGVTDSAETWTVGGGFYTTGELRTVNGTTFQKFLQGFVVLNNSGPQSMSAGCFQDGITHGLGHALGLGHSTSAGAMMTTLPSASCASGPRGLEADDRSGITAIYQGIASGPFSPGTPSGLSAVAVLSDVTLSWTTNPNGGPPQRHIVDAGNTVSGVYGLGSAIFDGPGTTAGFNGVPPGTYFVRVHAQNAIGTSSPSNEAQVTVGACVPPLAPGTLSASTNGNAVNLQWLPPLGGVTQGYRLAVGSQPGLADLLVGDYPSTVTALAAAVPFGVYYTRVHATNVCGISAPSNEVAVVAQPCAGPPGPPTNFRFATAGTFVSLAWDAPAGPAPTSYTLIVGSQPGLSDLLVQPTGNPSTSLGGPVPPGTYYARISAENPCGVSGVSNEIVVVVP